MCLGLAQSHCVSIVADSAESLGIKWATPAPGGAWSQIATGSMSGATTSITGLSGENLMIYIDGISQSQVSNETGTIRFNSDTGNNYYRQGNSNNVFSNLIFFSNSAGTVIAQNVIFIPNITTGRAKPIYVQPPNSDAVGVWKSTSAITSVQLSISAGSWDGGTYYVYKQ